MRRARTNAQEARTNQVSGRQVHARTHARTQEEELKGSRKEERERGNCFGYIAAVRWVGKKKSLLSSLDFTVWKRQRGKNNSMAFPSHSSSLQILLQKYFTFPSREKCTENQRHGTRVKKRVVQKARNSRLHGHISKQKKAFPLSKRLNALKSVLSDSKSAQRDISSL